MNPGQFRHSVRITIVSETQSTDFGDFGEDSNTSYDRFCKIKWLHGNETEEADTITLNKNVEFTFRYESIIELLDRIDIITYKTDKFSMYNIEYKGHGNQQYISIKAKTFSE